MKKQKIFQLKGRFPSEILGSIREMKEADSSWANGKMFGFVYSPCNEATELMQQISLMYLFDNGLSASHFPSLARLETEVVAMTAELLNGGIEAAGTVTSGGSESILMAMKTARDHARGKNPEQAVMEVIIPRSAHPAFHKAAHFLGLRTVTLPLGADYRADLSVLHNLINDCTIMMVGSAPSYSHGVVDPIEEMGLIANEREIYFHVDACLGGFFLPFMEMLGCKTPRFDFRIPGVTSISADLHKYAYGSKGASIILYRNREMRRKQFFVHCDWPGGLYGSTTIQGSRNGVPVATAWAMLNYQGIEGCMELTNKTLLAAEGLKKGIGSIPGLTIVGEPVMSVFSFTSSKIDIYSLGDELKNRGWILDSIAEPPALHFIVSYQNLTHIDEFLDDLQDAVIAVKKAQKTKIANAIERKIGAQAMKLFPGMVSSLIGRKAAHNNMNNGGRENSSVFYGIAASLENKSSLNGLVMDFLDEVYFLNL